MTRKDLDLDVAFRLPPRLREEMVGQLAADCGFLEAAHVMDYSLLMGVHYRSAGEAPASPLHTDKVRRGPGVCVGAGRAWGIKESPSSVH